MEVKVGYKLTDIGVIPDDWNADSLISLTPMGVKNNIVDGPFGSNLKTIHYRKSGIPIITSGYVTNGKFIAERYLYVDEAKFKEEKRSAVKSGDIVMAKIGERCGASAILPDDHQEGILSGNALKITIDLQKHSNLYIWHALWNLHCSGKLEYIRTTGAQPAISIANLKNYLIPIPPTKDEEDKIAEALSDADKLIESLENLIEKKRQIKQGAMQELLTGKKRLPGFSGEWEEKSLGDIAIALKGSGLSKSKLSDFGLNSCILYGELFTTYGREIKNVVSKTNSYDGIDSEDGDVLVPASTTTSGIDLAIASAINRSGVKLGGDINIIRKKNDASFDSIFLSYYLTNSLRAEIAEKAQGTTIIHLYGRDLLKLKIRIPENLEEQTAIASVLTDLDAEISGLDTKLTKAGHIKQGMMQELLTGRVRLV